MKDGVTVIELVVLALEFDKEMRTFHRELGSGAGTNARPSM